MTKRMRTNAMLICLPRYTSRWLSREWSASSFDNASEAFEGNAFESTSWGTAESISSTTGAGSPNRYGYVSGAWADGMLASRTRGGLFLEGRRGR